LPQLATWAPDVAGDQSKAKETMSRELCIGIASKDGSLALAAFESGRPAVEVNFPATEMGVEAIKIYLVSCREPVRLAVAGVAALTLALALGNLPGRRETFIVSSAVAAQPNALAHYARHTP
jgi:hypothetical protein